MQETIRTLEKRVAEHQAASAQWDALAASAARVCVERRLERFGFEDKRRAFEAVGLRVTANGKAWEATGALLLEAGIQSQSCC